MAAISGSSNSFNNYFTISEENKQKLKETIKKIGSFINANKSLIFFACSFLFSYYYAPLAAFEFYDKSDFIDAVVYGILGCCSILTLKNFFTSKPISKSQDDQINYLTGITNVAVSYLLPVFGLVNAVESIGFVAIKTVFKHLFTEEDKKIYFMINRNAANAEKEEENEANKATEVSK